ncbi:hypothetical protein [Gulosibacter molinativorax]|uniref:SMI1/KNR4 family protein n=1 Tax=Gulosibacter molinativorax TaxID=256821 RepID=A0ABT7C5M0_9MICO|nr:hypothetical protein [Gulosibacter molinativorax]MDJ1370488.1 hypothetical protein [Gulosibacter molinativorax]QUY62102.1 Hypotetical protein [Gulosibacter molinativorax]
METRLTDEIVERALGALPAHPPGADQEVVREVLSSTGLPEAPTLSALLARTNGLDHAGINVFGVGESSVDALADWSESLAPLIPVGLGGNAFGWHRVEESWVEMTTYSRDVVQRYASDAELLHDLFCRHLPGYVPEPEAIGAPPLEDLLSRVPVLTEPAAPKDISRAAATFMKRTGVSGQELRKLWQRTDGVDRDGLVIFGARQFSEASWDADPACQWAIQAGHAGREAIVFNSRERQWQLVAGPYSWVLPERRFSSLADLIAAVFGEGDPEHPPAPDQLDPLESDSPVDTRRSGSIDSVADVSDLLESLPRGIARPPAGGSATRHATTFFARRTGRQPGADLEEFLGLCDGFEWNGLILHGSEAMLRVQDDLPEHLFAVGQMDDRILVFDASEHSWNLLDAGALDIDQDADRFPSFTMLVAEAVSRRVSDSP